MTGKELMRCIICQIDQQHLTEDLHLCPKCGLVSSSVSPEVTLYDKSYQRKYERYDQTEIGRKLLESRVSLVNEHAEQGELLDFGCGTGSFVRCWESAVGFDINPFSSYCDVTLLFGRYDIVTFWDSLEHLRDPVAVIRGLAPSWIFISTPCYDDFLRGARIEQLTGWHHYYPGEHVHYFSEQSLDSLMKLCSYEVVFKGFDESQYRRSGGDKNIITVAGVAREAGIKRKVKGRPTATKSQCCSLIETGMERG